MIISAKNLKSHLGTMTYPVPVLKERGQSVAFQASRPMLEDLIKKQAVIGIGTKKSVKTVRLNTIDLKALDEQPDGKDAETDPYRGDGPKFTYDESLGNGIHLPMLKRLCPDGEFRRWDMDLTFADLREQSKARV